MSTTTGSGAAPEFSVVIPCLDEAETLGVCVRKARTFFAEAGIDAEVIVADNGSEDGSQDIARDEGARVVPVSRRGYGAALAGGIAAARGRFVIMGDADDSYDFSRLEGFVRELRAGHDLVMGNRFRSGIANGAMPVLHRLLGNPVLTAIGRRFFGARCGDFYCGLRGFRRQAVLDLGLVTTGMEFALEMVSKASMAGLSITEVPTTLSPDGRRTRRPHLRTWNDGWRSLRFFLVFSPRWLFLHPGLFTLGSSVPMFLAFLGQTSDHPSLNRALLVLGTVGAVVGYQAVLLGLFGKMLAVRTGLHPSTGGSERARAWYESLAFEHGILKGFALAAFGAAMVWAVLPWWQQGGLELVAADAWRRAAAVGAVCLPLGVQTVLSGLQLGMLGLAAPTPPRAA